MPPRPTSVIRRYDPTTMPDRSLTVSFLSLKDDDNTFLTEESTKLSVHTGDSRKESANSVFFSNFSTSMRISGREAQCLERNSSRSTGPSSQADSKTDSISFQSSGDISKTVL